jgi:two-component system cell cycle sensor histidine kinase/response regulator CckA
VLLDLTMPLTSGEETLHRLRAIRPDIPVLLSSGYNQVEVAQRFTGQGVAGFVSKPFSPAALVAKIKSACTGSSDTAGHNLNPGSPPRSARG